MNNEHKEVQINGLIYIIHDETSTAEIIGNDYVCGDFFIPRSIIYESQCYIVKTILKNSFNKSQDIKRLYFPSDSELTKIEEYSFYDSSLQIVSFPLHLIEIEDHAFGNCLCI